MVAHSRLNDFQARHLNNELFIGHHVPNHKIEGVFILRLFYLLLSQYLFEDFRLN